MDEIKNFVDAVYTRFESLFSPNGDELEDEQHLPDRAVFERICHVLLNVSTMSEEDRYPSFRVCCVDPGAEFLESYIYAHSLFFEKPLLFTERELAKLAPCLNERMSYLLVDIKREPYEIIGINASYTTWEQILVKEISTGNRMPRIPNIFVREPGVLEACFGESCFACYHSGMSLFFRTDAFYSSHVADALRKGSHLLEEHRLEFLYRVLWEARSYGHGGSIFIAPDEESLEGTCSIKYRMRSSFAFLEEEKGLEKIKEEKTIVTYADMIAKFTTVDGAVILGKDLQLFGFGGEFLSHAQKRAPSMCFIDCDGNEDKSRRFNDNGMRHRACYNFCNVVKDSVAIVISQDGTIKCCTKVGGRVYVYDHVSLPLL